MVIYFLAGIIVVPILYILFSSPKGIESSNVPAGQQQLIHHSRIKNSYPSTKDVFNTLKKANIPPCFLEVEDEN